MKEYNKSDIEKVLQNNSVELFEVLDWIDSDSYIPIINQICKKGNIDYFDLAYQALEKNINGWIIWNILLNLIPYSKIDIDNVLKFYKQLYSKEKEVSGHFNLTRALVSNENKIAKILLKKFLKIDNNFIIPHVSAILIELHTSMKESQYETIINYLKSDNLLQIQSAIGYIHLFNFSNEELKEIFKLFKQKVKLKNKEIDKSLLYNSYYLIKNNFEYFSEILLLYIDNNDIYIKQHIAEILKYLKSDHLNKRWFQKILLSIINANIEQQNIISNIESILVEYLKKDNYDLVKKILLKWSEENNLLLVLSKSTLNTFIPKFNKHQLFSRFITEILVCENSKLHSILPKLMINAFDSSKQNIKLDIDIMKTFTKDDYLYVCRKILGYFYEFNHISTMIFSIFAVSKLEIDTKNLISDIFINYIGKSYHTDTLEYFKNMKDINLNKNEKEIKTIVINELAKRQKEIQKLTRLKELTPSSQQDRTIRRTLNIATSNAMEESEKDSFFSLISNKIIICCGRGSFGEYNGKFTDVSYLNTYSHSIVIPTPTRTHPVNYELEKLNFRQVKKVNK